MSILRIAKWATAAFSVVIFAGGVAMLGVNAAELYANWGRDVGAAYHDNRPFADLMSLAGLIVVGGFIGFAASFVVMQIAEDGI